MVASVRIGIVSWNTADLLDRCLASLSAATEGLDCQVVVVDNASSDGSAGVVRSHPFAVLVSNDVNVGYARAMNQALEFGDPAHPPDALVALNPDTVAPPASITSLVSRLFEQPDVGLVVPKLVGPDGSPQHSVYRFPSPPVSAAAAFVPVRMQSGRFGLRFGLEAAPPITAPSDVDWALGAVHVIRTEAAGTLRPYNERWFMYAEDLDLCWTLARSGWRRRIHPEVEITHVGNAAGIQAWGPGRIAQWLPATYDWYRLRKGEMAMRCWAATNVAGTLWRLVGAAPRRLRGRPVEGWQRDLRPALRRHVAALVGHVRVGSP